MRCQNGKGQLLPSYGSFRARVLVAMVRGHWLVNVHWLFIVAVAVLLAVERVCTGTFARPPALVLSITALALVNTLWAFLGRHFVSDLKDDTALAPPRSSSVSLFANLQVGVAILLLTVILRYSGGIENPMVILFLFYVAIAGLLLESPGALLQGLWALLLYAALLVGECTGWIAPHFPLLPWMPELEAHRRWGLVLTDIGVLAAGVFVTLCVALKVSGALEKEGHRLGAANEALRGNEAAIRSLQTRQSKFMQTAAHQLKSPVAGIETLAGLIRDKVVPADGIPGIIDRIIGRCRQAMVQVADLLTLARLRDLDPTPHRPVSTPVRQAVDKIVARFSEQAALGGLTVHWGGVEGDTTAIAVDPRDFEDCLVNLLDNAIKYTPRGGTIWVSVSEGIDTVSISVRDTGMGIAEDPVDDLFDPFRRGNLALLANIPGTGLGLAIVREVVEQAGGKICVHSVPTAMKSKTPTSTTSTFI